MKIEEITIANLKCNGCANTIKSKISGLEGVDWVKINLEENKVSIAHDGDIPRTNFTQKLLSLGYPEATEENGLLLQLKSYASCMTGRMSSSK